MSNIVLQNHPDTFRGPCGVCGKPTALVAGLQLCQAEKGRPICGICGRRAAPALAALVGLANAAERVGRINRHTVVPPLTALMDSGSIGRIAGFICVQAIPSRLSGSLQKRQRRKGQSNCASKSALH